MSSSVKTVLRLGVGIILGQLVSSYELRYMLSREYYGEINGIEVYRTGDVNEDNLALHTEMLKNAPEQLTECCDRIYFTGTDLELPIHDAGLGNALGLTQGGTVYISTASFSSYVVYHELFHAFDNARGIISSSDEFTRLYEENKRFLPVYASNDGAYESEFFAQAGALYLIMPRELSVAAPGLYKYYDETLGFGSDKTVGL